MKLKSIIALSLLASFSCMPVHAQRAADDSIAWKSRMQWFQKAKLGIFIHWGIYAVKGISESWSFYNGQISYKDYMDQAKGFTASKWNPKDWVDLIRESGAQYTVLTTKHHDGMALWNTKAGKLSTVKCTSARRDLITPFVSEVRRQGLKVGLYFSLLDWSNKDYPNFTRTQKRYDNNQDLKRWQKFVDFDFAQLRELNTQYHPDLWWFDGDWEQTAEKWHAPEMIKLLRQTNPDCIVNSRIQGYGDYATPEVGIPVFKPKDPYWELCMTINDSWGYQPKDTLFKTPYELLRVFCDCLSNGGNLLLDIGPREDGTIPQPEVDVLKEFGRWINKHREAVYSTRAGVYSEAFQGYTTLNEKGDILYLYIPYEPHGEVEVNGVMNKIKNVRVVGSNRQLKFNVYNAADWRDVPGNLYIQVPDSVLDPEITVLAVQLDGPVRMYHEKNQSDL